MKANLAWAARQRGLTHYKVAAGVGMSESAFSRGLTGRRDFTAEEKRMIADFLGYDMSWLFQPITPPERRKPKNYAAIMTA